MIENILKLVYIFLFTVTIFSFSASMFQAAFAKGRYILRPLGFAVFWLALLVFELWLVKS